MALQVQNDEPRIKTRILFSKRILYGLENSPNRIGVY